MSRIPWRDNGLLLAAVGFGVCVALALIEGELQGSGFQSPVISFTLQADNETDKEEESDGAVRLSHEQQARINTLLVEAVDSHFDNTNHDNHGFDWQVFKTQHPAVTDTMWQALAVLAAKKHRADFADAVFEDLLQKSQSEELLFQYAKVASSIDNDTQAVERYRALLQVYPYHQASYINLGLALARLDRHQETVDLMTTAVGLSSGVRLAKAYSIRGSSYLSLDQPIAAVADFNSSIQYRPGHAATWRKLANALMAVGGRDEEVLEAFNQSIKLKSDSLIGLHDRARFFWLQGDLQRARQDLKTASTLASDYQPARWTLLHLYIAMDKQNSAKTEISWLKKQSLDTFERTLLTGLDEYIGEDYVAAAETFARLRTESGGDKWPLYYFSRTEIIRHHNLDQQVIVELQRLRSHPWLSAVATQVLSDYYARHQVEESLALMQELSVAHPQSSYYAYLLGRLYLYARMPVEAASALQRAVLLENRGMDKQSLNRQDTQTLLSLAIAYNRSEQIDLAINTYKKILTIRASHREALFNYANLLVKMGKPADAIDKFERLLDVDPGNNRARYLLARLYSDDDRFERSVTLLKDALAEDPNYHLARRQLVEIQMEQGRLDAAFAEVERLLVLSPNNFGGLLLKSDILRDQWRLREAAKVLLNLPDESYSRKVIVKLYNLGKRALGSDELVLAEICNRRVIDKDSTFDKAWVNLSAALLRQQKNGDVIALLQNQEALLALNPKLVINLAEAYFLNGQNQLAINLLTPLQQRDQLSGEGQQILAKSHRAL